MFQRSKSQTLTIYYQYLAISLLYDFTGFCFTLKKVDVHNIILLLLVHVGTILIRK